MIPVFQPDANLWQRRRSRYNRKRGQTTIEFAVSILTLLFVIMAGVEIDRLALVYSSLTNGAQIAVSYAIVHGSSRKGEASGEPECSAADLTKIVKYFAQLGTVDTSKLTVSASWPSGNDNPGSPVNIFVSYPYTPMTFVPMNVTLKAVSRGIIAF